MTDMLSVVARAIAGICNDKGQELASKCEMQAPSIPWQAFKREAKAALEAMRSPTDEMIDRSSRARVAARHKMPSALTLKEYAAPDIMQENRSGMREALQAAADAAVEGEE